MKASTEYVARAIGTLEGPGGTNVTILRGRCDDMLYHPTLQVGVVGDDFGTGSVEVFITTQKSIDTSAAPSPQDGEPDGPMTTLQAGIASTTVVQLPACFGFLVQFTGASEFESVRVRLGGNAYTTHPNAFVQGPA
jgi:hypothetical protein